MLALVKRLMREEQGQDLAEYGIAMAVIAVGAGLAATVIAGNVETLWNNAQAIIAQIIGLE